MYLAQENFLKANVFMRKMSIWITTEDFAVLCFLMTFLLGNLSAGWWRFWVAPGERGEGSAPTLALKPPGFSMRSAIPAPPTHKVGYFPAVQRCWESTECFPMFELKKMHFLYAETFFFSCNLTWQDLLHTRNENLSLESNTVTIAINLHSPQVTPGCWV